MNSSQTTKRTFDREFKLQVVRQLKSGEKRLAQLCREHNLCQTLVRRWREQYERQGENAWLDQQAGSNGGHVLADDKARIAALEAALGRAHLEVDFLRHCLRELEQKRASESPRNGR
ncbi:MAG TPA: transposase [Chloroflexota bacterium]|nr:transposase [Chloroflexota bacterium]